MIVNEISNNYDLWSDLEMGLSDFLSKLDIYKVDEFIESKNNLEEELIEYLLAQEKRIIFGDKKALALEFKNMMLNFCNEFNTKEKETYKNFIKNNNATIKYTFITFNYTNILDLIVKYVKEELNPFNIHTGSNGLKFNDVVTEPLHIHGTLEEDMILGINSPEQIKNVDFQNNEKILKCMVKSVMNSELGEKRMDSFRNLIMNSRYICIFGLSVGETDQIWWKEILSWLKKSTENRLVIYRLGNFSKVAARKISDIDKERDFFKNQSCCTEEDFKNIRNKIIIIKGSDLFKFNNIKLGNNIYFL